MLARLDKIDGVSESRVDWTGQKVLIRLKSGADSDRVSAQAAKHLGSGAVRLSAARETEQIDGFRRGEPWLRAGETLELSRHESKVLGKSLAARAGRSILDDAALRRLETVLEEEFFAIFSRIHAGEVTLDQAFERAGTESGPRIEKRLLEYMTRDQAAEVLAALRDSIFGGH